MAEAFMGYLLPWGQMSYWGAQVIISLFSAIPVIGDDLSLWIRGDYVVSDATLNRFFAFHVIAVPLVLVMLVFLHIVALHEVGSNNPDGMWKSRNLKIRTASHWTAFHSTLITPLRILLVPAVFLIFFAAIIFYMPEMGGFFLEADNFIPADPLKTPEHIVTPVVFHAVLRHPQGCPR